MNAETRTPSVWNPCAGLERVPGSGRIDWHLLFGDFASAGLFTIGFFAILLGAPGLGMTLWAACVWIDWRNAVYLRDEAMPAAGDGDRSRLRQYVRYRLLSIGVAHVLAVLLGLYALAVGRPWVMVGLWALAAAGFFATRVLRSVRYGWPCA